MVTFSIQKTETRVRLGPPLGREELKHRKPMKMISNIACACLAVLLLLNSTGAKPVSDLQSIKQLLEEESNVPYYASEETEGEGGKGLNTEKSALEAWDSDVTNSALAGKENALARLLKDIMRTSKRSWNRYKKGGLRSCFGVRLERIGSFSGLGC